MADTITWQADYFKDLDIYKLYNLLYLRAEVFVVEQICPYLDPDNKDYKALHLQGYVGEKLVAYCRLFKPGDYFKEASIGRVVVAADYRKYGYGHQLMAKAIELQASLLRETKITISAQLYLKKFYESHGFIQTSDVYPEDDIPHIEMKLERNFLKSNKQNSLF